MSARRVFFDWRPRDMTEMTFPAEQACHLQFLKLPEPLCSPKNEHSCNASSSTNDSASDGTYNANPLSISDDIELRHEPLRYVDYLSHAWQEDDLWSSWKHVVSGGGLHEEPSRFENALWREWAKSKYKLKTTSPEKIDW
jgi:hypothetical protein